ncbi:MAG: acyltransferase [Polyangiaceae bacterium]|nr:acyltransferase [Polyangiaceae bacterium]
MQPEAQSEADGAALHGAPPRGAGSLLAGHVPALDGLRGLALAGVLAFHAETPVVGGFLGVDLFFVLSGFLITALLVKEHGRTGRIDLRAFWVRRARRLLPALFLVILAVALYAKAFAKRDELHSLRWDALATLGYVANWRSIYADKSYWDLFSSPSPLQHTWSLAIEEQFYLVWPLAIFAALRRFGRRGAIAMTATLAAVSAGAMLLLYDPERTSRVYFGTDTRATGLCMGALLALLLPIEAIRRSRTAVRAFDVAGIAASVGILASWLYIGADDALLYRGGFWGTELFALVVITCAVVGRGSLVAFALSNRPLRWLGTISYGAYLWHWPVHVAVTSDRVPLQGLGLEALRFVITLAVATASYVWLEAPIRAGRMRLVEAKSVIFAAAALSVVMVTGATYAHPLPARLKPMRDDLAAALADGRQEIRLRIAVYGDSTANSLGWCFRGVRDPGVTVTLMGDDGFSVLTHEPSAWKTPEADVNLLFLGGAFLYGFRVEGKWTKACAPAWQERFEENLDAWIGRSGDLEQRLWVATVPYPVGRYDNETQRNEVDCINRSIRTVTAKHPSIHVLPLGDMLCPKGVCTKVSDGVQLRPDGVHYDIDGTRPLAHTVLDYLEKNGGRAVR